MNSNQTDAENRIQIKNETPFKRAEGRNSIKAQEQRLDIINNLLNSAVSKNEECFEDKNFDQENGSPGL